MALTQRFRETIMVRVKADVAFRRALLKEGVEAMLGGDVASGKIALRDYINATVGFGPLAEATNIPAKSLMRMLGPKGNPRAENLFLVLSHLQALEGIRLEVSSS